MEYSYTFPSNFKTLFTRFAEAKGCAFLSELINRSTIKHQDLGYAYYIGIRGSFWNSHAIDVELWSPNKDIEILKQYKTELISIFNKSLDPSTTGLIIHDILFLEKTEIDVKLPEEEDLILATLRPEILRLVEEGKPVLALDRLHTFTTTFLRKICERNNISVTTKSGKYLPIHSLLGQLCTRYDETNAFESDFTLISLRMSISLLEKFNEIRNNQSYAHSNIVLNKNEAKLVLEIVSSIMNFLDTIQPDHSTYVW